MFDSMKRTCESCCKYFEREKRPDIFRCKKFMNWVVFSEHLQTVCEKFKPRNKQECENCKNKFRCLTIGFDKWNFPWQTVKDMV